MVERGTRSQLGIETDDIYWCNNKILADFTVQKRLRTLKANRNNLIRLENRWKMKLFRSFG